MLKALSNTVAQLSEPSLRKILFYSVLLALASIVICSGLGWLLLDQFGLLGFGFLDSFLPWIGASLIIVMGLVFFPSTIMLVASLFSDRIIRAVEEKYYPENIGTVHVPLTSSIKTSLTLIVIASIVNIFIQSSAMQFAISVIGVLVFVGLTAYDTQNIKNMYYGGDSEEIGSKKALMGALKLYLDFINLFILLLQLFGQRR